MGVVVNADKKGHVGGGVHAATHVGEAVGTDSHTLKVGREGTGTEQLDVRRV